MQQRDDERLRAAHERRARVVALGFVLTVLGAWLLWGWEAAVLVAGALLFRGTS